MAIAEDAVAGTDDSCGLALHEHPERVAVASQDGVDSGAFIDDLCWAGGLAELARDATLGRR